MLYLCLVTDAVAEEQKAKAEQLQLDAAALEQQLTQAQSKQQTANAALKRSQKQLDNCSK